MSNSYKGRSYYSSYLRMEDLYGVAGGSVGGVGTSKTHFSPQMDNSGIDRHDGGFQKYKCQSTSSTMELFRMRDYPVGESDGYLFHVDAGYGKGGVDPRTTQLTSQKFDF